MVGLDASLGARDPQSLSVGQQQRVSLARALALEPEVLLMDEPTSALDEAARRTIEELIRELNSSLGLTVVVVSHYLDQGADPLAAARLQIVVLYMLLGSVSIAAILVGLLSYRSFFTPRHQLRSAPIEY
jgi:ABC-type sulfate/molybdate transport systems ATPase subunit